MSNSFQAGPLRFRYWPFDIVPRQNERLVWADRSELKTQIDRLMRRLGRHEAVSLHLLWADFGAGKTHTLLYLKQEAEGGKYGSLLPLYSALPKGCRQFLDIYRAIVRGIPVSIIEDAYHAASSKIGADALALQLSKVWEPLPRCFRAIGIGSEAQRLSALGWLHAEPGLANRDLQALSIVGRVRSTDEAVLALCGIVKLLNLAGHQRVLLMVDEFQRVEALRRQQQDDINAGLHGFFNAASRGMSLLLSFSFGVESNIKHFLNAELLSRVDPLRLSIPKLQTAEGAAFLNDVIAQATDPDAKLPITPDVVAAIVEQVADRFELTPRRLIKAAGLVFDLASIDLEDGKIEMLDRNYVEAMVARGDFSRLDDNEGEENGVS